MDNTKIDALHIQVDAATLAHVFGVSQRQIELLVSRGILSNAGTSRRLAFDLERAVPEYIVYLTSGVPAADWAPDV